MFVCLIFLTRSQPELLEKKILPKFTNMLKYLYMNSQQQTKKVTKNDLCQCGFLRTLLTWQRCIQNISNNLREVDYKKSSARLLFWWEIFVQKYSCFWFHKVAKFRKRSKKNWNEPKNWIWKISLICNFHQQEKF